MGLDKNLLKYNFLNGAGKTNVFTYKMMVHDYLC